MNKKLYLQTLSEKEIAEENGISVDFDDIVEKKGISAHFDPKYYFECIDLDIDLKRTLKEQTDYTKELEEKIIEEIETNFFWTSEESKILTEIIESKKSLLEYVDEVHFDTINDEILNYIQNNKELYDKKIIIDKKIPAEEKFITNILEKIGDRQNVFVCLENNEDSISIQECKETFKAINDIIDEVKSYNFSPLEELLYIYDIVRDRVYTKENKNQDATTSRDLSKALLGDKIVCLGYAAIFDSILKKLGYKSTILVLTGNQNAHARNRVYINDEKYNLEGIYEFDTTWDSKKSEGDNSFLNSYKFFANTKVIGDLFLIDTFSKQYKESEFPALVTLCLNPNEILQYIENDCIMDAPLTYRKTLNNIFLFMQGKTLEIPDLSITEPILKFMYNQKIKCQKESIKIDTIKYLNLFINKIPDETLMDALLVVRKKQNEKNPDKYPYDNDTFLEIAINSNWDELFEIEKETEYDNESLDYKEVDEFDENLFIKKKTLR